MIEMLPRFKLVLTVLQFLCVASVVSAQTSERARVVRRCTQIYEPVVDHKRHLFSINDFYVLRLNFNRGGRLTQLAVEPKYYYDDDHPDWSQPANFPYLSKTEYEGLLAAVNPIKSIGPVVKPASAFAVVTNMTAWRRQTHRGGILEWGEVVDLRRGPDAPLLVRWFRVYYSKRGAVR